MAPLDYLEPTKVPIQKTNRNTQPFPKLKHIHFSPMDIQFKS